MKTVIDDFWYDTDEAEWVATANPAECASLHRTVSLYRTPGGRYFLYTEAASERPGSVPSQDIRPLTDDLAMAWLQENEFFDECEACFFHLRMETDLEEGPPTP